MDEMPMFPLGMTLVPAGVLPLHVFEPRYRQMIIDILQRDGTPEFGQALITRGTETGGGDVRADIGTVAQIVQMAALDEGRYAMVTVGTRRIRIHEWLPDDPYPRAIVEDWPDEFDDSGGGRAVGGPDTGDSGLDLPERITAASRRISDVTALAVEAGAVEAPPASDGTDDDLDDDLVDDLDDDLDTSGDTSSWTDISATADPVAASYGLVARAPVGDADRFRLLAARGPVERLALLDEVLDDVEAMLRFRLT